MTRTRRDFLGTCAKAAAFAPPLFQSTTARGSEAPDSARREQPLGVVIHSFTQRVAASQSDGGAGRFGDAMAFLDHCHTLGARGVQVGIGIRDEAACRQLRAQAAAYSMDLEGTVRLPRDRSDLDRFTAEVQSAVWSGATLLRTAMLAGRRYETFSTASAFRAAADAAVASLALAEPVAARLGVRLAVENHKDWRADELVTILKQLSSAHVGACVDTGNSIALLEDPIEVIQALAPWAFTTHLKDMAVQEYERGFLLAEIPLGEGFLDLRTIVRILRTARPEIALNLEMITRDPLEIPCLTEKYWATFADVSGRHLARSLTMVRSQGAKRPLQRISGLSREAKFHAEDENVRRSFSYALAELKP